MYFVFMYPYPTLPKDDVYNLNQFCFKTSFKVEHLSGMMISLWLWHVRYVSHPGVRKVQVSVGRSSAEILQDLSAGRRELQRGEMRSALLLTGRCHHNVPV